MIKVAHVCTSSISHKILVDKLSILKKKGYIFISFHKKLLQQRIYEQI